MEREPELTMLFHCSITVSGTPVHCQIYGCITAVLPHVESSNVYCSLTLHSAHIMYCTITTVSPIHLRSPS